MKRVRLCENILFLVLTVLSLAEAEWSEWGEYGDCSRKCGGGLANKTRTCLGASQTCEGSDIRYRTCNKQGCGEDGLNHRQLQCKSYDGVAIKDNYFRWVPHVQPGEPCVLYCRTLETDFVLKMEDQVLNGTSCGPEGNGVCISGRCKKVGCTGVVGSKRVFDACGICGGNGSTCMVDTRSSSEDKTPWRDAEIQNYTWDVGWSSCSQNCGTGTQTSEVKCISTDTKLDVDEMLCDPNGKPDVLDTRQCTENKACKHRWHAFKWGTCSRTCGSGSKYRRVICLKQDKGGANRKRVNDRKCLDAKPDIQAPCNMGDCPEWLTGPWTKCSVPCGYGQQKRKVVCKTSTSAFCSLKSKPPTLQRCNSGRSCQADRLQQDDSALDKYDFYEDAKLQELLLFPEFKVTSWGACSVTCGVGYRYRNVTCVRGKKILPLLKCKGIQPHSKTECHKSACPWTSGSSAAYTWSHGQFGPCSKSCGKGTQLSVLQCIESDSGKAVLDVMCVGIPKPGPVKQPCNAVPCPPSWKVGDYSECTVPCGGGIQSRDVSCIQVTANGGEQPIESHRCPEPVPLYERSCNVRFCQAEWSTDPWGECSVTCGFGVERRIVFCVKYLNTGLKVNVSDSECIGARPDTTRQCHFGDCYKLNHLPAIKEQKGTFIQIKRTKRIGLVIGETAILLPNQAVKIKCPVKNFHRKLVFWTKGHRLVRLIGRVRVSSNGALRISRADPVQDSGTFTCSAGMLHATINITFHSKKEATRRANNILQDIFQENLNETFINRPQRDEMLKIKRSKNFHINSIPNSGYDYSSFTTSNWTLCSAKCGWGTQTRKVTCNQVTEKYIRLLPEEVCTRKKLLKPSVIQKCRIQPECPKWVTGDWTECSNKYCREDGYAFQKRSLYCHYPNGSDTHQHNCDMSQRPEHRRKCSMSSCQSVWHTSPWSKCVPRCGMKGKKHRALECVWASTKKSAYDNCRDKPRPKVSKSCKPQPCRPYDVCMDESNYCNLAGMLKMCRYSWFREQCCLTCKRANI